jgi:hypothetical protein
MTSANAQVMDETVLLSFEVFGDAPGDDEGDDVDAMGQLFMYVILFTVKK